MESARITILGSQENLWANTVYQALCRCGKNQYYFVGQQEVRQPAPSADGTECLCLYVPALVGREGVLPDLNQAEEAFQQFSPEASARLVLISSALIYGIGPGRPAFAGEEYSAPGAGKRICDQWIRLERLAQRWSNGRRQLTILRPAPVIPSPTIFSQLLSHKFVPALPGHDAVMQFLSVDDLAAAIDRAFEKGQPGIFNIAPDAVVPLHGAIRAIGGHRIAIPRTLQRLVRNSQALEYLRYHWTVSSEKAKRELDFVPAKSSFAALREWRGKDPGGPEPQFDNFGMDKSYIQFYGKTLFRFLCDYYWRVEARGLEHVPRAGRAVLVGVHRGFMPWDGVMALQLLVRKAGRYPRFLTHPGLLRFPFIANFVTKLGGVTAWQESAGRVLQQDDLLVVFPEGVQGAFCLYRDAYRLHEFGRDAFVKIALRHRAPIIPFVTVGSAEAFPILAKLKSRLWTRYTGWPCFPITPTFPLLPVPLPSKWHMQFLPPLHIEQEHPPEAARNNAIVKAISAVVRLQLQQTMDDMRGRRSSIFWGSIFKEEAGG